MASATFPGVFSPIVINGSFYVDGGVLNNFPIEPLLSHCDKIIGSYVNPLKSIKPKDLKHSYNVVDRAYKIKSVSDSIAKFGQCDLVISPEELSSFATFDMRYIETIFEIGYNSTIKKLNYHGYIKQMEV